MIKYKFYQRRAHAWVVAAQNINVSLTNVSMYTSLTTITLMQRIYTVGQWLEGSLMITRAASSYR